MVTAFTLEPDVTLTLDDAGVIRDARASGPLALEALDHWSGKSWNEVAGQDVNKQVSDIISKFKEPGASSLLRFTQRFPSGREVPMEFSTVSLGKGAGFVALGRSMQMVSDLQARLEDALQAREQDYWKLRDIESRYRVLFDSSDDAVLLVRTNNLRIVEANVAASRNLGLLPGSEFLPGLTPRDKRVLEGLLDKVREGGRAPSVILHLGRDNAAWSLRASSMEMQNGSFFLFQMAPVGARPDESDAGGEVNCGDIVNRLPDGFVVVDAECMIRSANLTFLDLVQIGAEGAVLGENLNRWLSKPGANASSILAMIQRHGSVSLLPTVLSGELGSNMDVEISAVGDRDNGAEHFGLMLRDVTLRSRQETAEGSTVALSDPFESSPQGISLELHVRGAVAAIEQRLIDLALMRSDGNRTVAARLLGLSRQSLHTKLKKYDFE